MSNVHRVYIVYSDSDATLLAEYNASVSVLSRLVIEMLEDPKTLLSPTYREILLAQARKTYDAYQCIHSMLCIDNSASSYIDTESK